MTDSQPLVSIFTSCKNAEPYLQATLDSIIRQTYRNIEIVVVDGLSKDNSIDILRRNADRDSRIKWTSEKDNDATEGFLKALNLTTGKYVMFLAVSDVLIDQNWIKKCIEVLEHNSQVSLVHGIPVNIDESGSITSIPHLSWLVNSLPSLINFTAYYFATFCYVSELNYCVRREVYMQCYPKDSVNHPKTDTSKLRSKNPDPFLWFLLNFFKKGYLAYYLPIIASGGRLHDTSRNNKFKKYIKALTYHYAAEIRNARSRFLSNPNGLQFLNSDSQVFKTLSTGEAFQFRMRIIYYRLTNLPMFGPRYDFMFIVTSLFIFFFEKPKNLCKIVLKKIKSRL